MAFGAFTIDADIEDCNFALCAKGIDRLRNPDEYPLMKRAAQNAVAWKVFLAEQYEIGEKDSKTMRIATLFRKKPSDDNPAMWALLDEILRFTAEVLEKPENAHFSTHFSDRRSPQASRLCYLLGAKEDGYVQDMLGKLKADPGHPGTS